jgi:hypothetical protein
MCEILLEKYLQQKELGGGGSSAWQEQGSNPSTAIKKGRRIRKSNRGGKYD